MRLINCPYSAGLTQFLYEMALTSRSVERSGDKNETRQLIPHAHLFAAYIAMWRYRIWKWCPRFDHFVYRAAVTSVFSLEPVTEQVRKTSRKRFLDIVDAPDDSGAHYNKTVILGR